MSTKNLARTLIEGGRTGGSKFQRRHYNRQNRRLIRQYLKHERWEEDPLPKPRRADKEFTDNFGPVYSFIESRVGQPWNKTWSDLKRSFDTRRLRNWHLVDLHIKLLVDSEYIHSRYPGPFWVNSDGLLCKSPVRKWVRPTFSLVTPEEIYAWAGNRRVGQRGAYLFWFVPVRWKHSFVYDRPDQVWLDKLRGREATRRLALLPSHFRQDARLSEDDVLFWNKISTKDRKALVYETE